MMMAASFEAGQFSVICCPFVCLNNLVFRVRVPVVQKGTYKILSCSILTCVRVCACMHVCVLMNNKAKKSY